MRVALALCLAISAMAQTTPTPPPAAAQPQDPEVRIRTFTKLVEVPVVVTDGSGRHVAGLTKDDFILLEDKVEKKIAAFEYVSTSQSPVTFRKMPAGLYSNLVGGVEGPRAVTVIVMDAVNTQFADQAYARYQLIKFLKGKIQPNSLVSLMVITRNGAKTIHDYTTDTSVLISAIEKVKGRSDSPTAEQVDARDIALDPTQSIVDQEAAALQDFASNADNTYASFMTGISMLDTLSALEGIANSLAGIPGRKSLVWATGSFPFYFDDSRGFSSTDFSPRLAKLFQQLNDNNIAIYPVDVRGLTNPAYSGPAAGIRTGRGQALNPGPSLSARSNALRNSIDTLKNAAEMTGGIAYYNTNDIAGSIQKAQDDAASYYVLAYYLTGAQETTPKWHKIAVKTRKHGLQVRARKGVFAPSTEQIKGARQNDLKIAERSPLPYTAIAMVVKWAGYQSGSITQEFEVRLAGADFQLAEPDNEMSFEIVAIARDAEGNLLDQTSQIVTGKIKKVSDFQTKPIVFADRFKLTAAPATVRFIVRDNNSGKMGSVIVTSNTIAASK